MELSSAIVREGGQFSRTLALSHYENFPIASRLLPRAMRQDLFNIYAYCRLADDFADDPSACENGTEKLDRWQATLDAAVAGKSDDPFFTALADTIRRRSLPLKPFHQLLDAFRLDLVKFRYDTWKELRHYTSLSADPVGRIVLGLNGIYDRGKIALSDKICTALQLVNHLQDVGEDWLRGRIYLPREDMERFAVTEQMIGDKSDSTSFRSLISFEAERARRLFSQGCELLKGVKRGLAVQLALYLGGGMAVLKALHRIDYDVLNRSAKLTRFDKANIGLRASRWFF